MAGKSHPKTDVRQEAARQLRAILMAVDRGELAADSGIEKRMLRRMEGAITALEFRPKKGKQKRLVY